MESGSLLLHYLPEIERTIAFVCRRRGLRDAEGEDFGSFVKLKLIEDDYAILGKFEGRCGFRTFISIVINRLFLDYQNHLLGKWRPSAEARRLGEMAQQLEQLVHRDRLTFEEAVAMMRSSGCQATESELRVLVLRLPSRPSRPREVELAALPHEPRLPGENAEQALERRERAETIARTVRDAIHALPDEDRKILRMRFEAGMTVAEISRAMHLDQKQLYRRIERYLASMRASLQAAGLDATDIERFFSEPGQELDFGFGSPLSADSSPFTGEGGGKDEAPP